MSAATVRRARADDADFVRALCLDTVDANVSEQRPVPREALERSAEHLLRVVEGMSHAVLIAEDGGARAGFALVLDEIPDEVTGLPQAFLAYVAVLPERRGRGLGRALMAAAEAYGRERGLPYLAFMVTERNVGARALYASLGYATERRLMCKAL